jgi:hypothetical protein
MCSVSRKVFSPKPLVPAIAIAEIATHNLSDVKKLRKGPEPSAISFTHLPEIEKPRRDTFWLDFPGTAREQATLLWLAPAIASSEFGGNAPNKIARAVAPVRKSGMAKRRCWTFVGHPEPANAPRLRGQSQLSDRPEEIGIHNIFMRSSEEERF